MSRHYQYGYLRCIERTPGLPRWEFLWREEDEWGNRVRRTAIIGTLGQYPTKESASVASNGLRMQINADRHRRTAHTIRVTDLIDHYLQTEFSADNERHAFITRMTGRYFMERWIRPQWGELPLECVRMVAVEHWLRRLRRIDGEPLANPTKAKIRGLFSVLFNHAIRCEWLGQDKNPIKLVRQSAKRKNTPAVLDSNELKTLLKQLQGCTRLMVMLDVTTGLRRSELFALKWADIDFSDLVIDIQRSIYRGHVGPCKTEASRKPVPLDLNVAADLWLWKEDSKFAGPEDWIFASLCAGGRQPLWPNTILQKTIRPAALRAGIRKTIGWHTFRHTYSTLLIAQGENIKVVQELMRHATSRCTLEIYSQAQTRAKRAAQQRLVQSVLPEATDTSIPEIDDLLGGIAI